MNEFFQKIILNEEQSSEDGYISAPVFYNLLNKQGIVLSDLKPSGFIVIDGKKYDARSEGQMIKRGENVKVIRIEGSYIIVRRI